MEGDDLGVSRSRWWLQCESFCALDSIVNGRMDEWTACYGLAGEKRLSEASSAVAKGCGFTASILRLQHSIPDRNVPHVRNGLGELKRGTFPRPKLLTRKTFR